jgi:hypothetical protein
MKEAEKGSSAWFVQARQICIDHLRALLSVRMAHEYIVAILGSWGTVDITIEAALHSACVIAYSRAFTAAATKCGKLTYSTKSVKAAPGFDGELHKHILDLRHRLVAHSDYDMFPSTMYLQTVGDERLPLKLGIKAKGIVGIRTRDLATRYEKHLSACVAGIERALNRDCSRLVSQSRLHPTAFQQTHNVPETMEEFVVGTIRTDLPDPTGPTSHVTDPAFPKGLSDYSYITLTHEVALIEGGDYVVNVRGVPTELTFSVEGGVRATAV